MQKVLVDQAMLQNNPVMQMQAGSVLRGSGDTRNPWRPIPTVLDELKKVVPSVVWNNVYQVDRAHLDSEDCEYVKLTFFNDQMIGLKARLIPSDQWNDAKLKPLCPDFEEWIASAIMKCDAGEEIWTRPKPPLNNPWAPSSQNSGQQMSQQNSNQALQGGLSSGMAGMGQGLISGLFGGRSR